MPKAGDIKYCDLLGGRKTNAAFVYVPPSAFWMGAVVDKNNPVHLVGVSKGFWIQQTPLTEEQFEYLTSENTSSFLRSKQPKTEINWTDVHSMISDKPLRMPTEAEWELAARAGVGHKYLYSGSNIAKNVAYTSNYSIYKPDAVAEFKTNSIGLYDMSGTVEEWCSDYNSNLSSTPQLDPQGPASTYGLRVIRGGSWQATPVWAWVAVRNKHLPDTRGGDTGVRLIWEI